MRDKRLMLYIHLIWATWDRDSLILPPIEKAIYRCIVNQVQKLGCEVIAINGVSDHVHLVLKYPSTVTIAQIVKQAKGVSSRMTNKHLGMNGEFKWQVGYGAFTISRWDLPKIVNYVKKQKKHHNEDVLNSELERIFSEN